MTVIRSVDGYWRWTRALATRRIVATRSATASVSTCSSGVPGCTAAAATTSSCGTAPSPVDDDVARRHDRREVQQQAKPDHHHAHQRRPQQHLQAPNRPAAKLFRIVLRPADHSALGLAARVLDRGGAGLGGAALLAFAPGPPPRALVIGGGAPGRHLPVQLPSLRGFGFAGVSRRSARSSERRPRPARCAAVGLHLQRRKDFGAQHGDVACTHGDHDIAGAGRGRTRSATAEKSGR